MAELPEMYLACRGVQAIYPQYPAAAYFHVRITLQWMAGQNTAITGSDSISFPTYVHGVLQYAMDQFGPMADTVLEDWKIHSVTDIQTITQHLMEFGLYRPEAFQRSLACDEVDILEVVRVPYRPEKPAVRPIIPRE